MLCYVTLCTLMFERGSVPEKGFELVVVNVPCDLLVYLFLSDLLS